MENATRFRFTRNSSSNVNLVLSSEGIDNGPGYECCMYKMLNHLKKINEQNKTKQIFPMQPSFYGVLTVMHFANTLFCQIA
jgi:hypothetical protein